MPDDQTLIESIGKLTPTAFENLVYDCLRAIGLTNLVWRTPGADGGRDIEGDYTSTDITGFDQRERWYIECKRYSSSIAWPLLWNKLAHADAHEVDVLFLVTNSKPSPKCETRISCWNETRRRPALRVWRGYELPSILRTHSTIARAHGLADPVISVGLDGLDLALVINKLVQSSYSSAVFGQDALSSLQAASCLAELLSHRLDDLNRYERFVRASVADSWPKFDWLASKGDPSRFEDVGLRAVLSYLHHASYGAKVQVSASQNEATIILKGVNIKELLSGSHDLNTVALWSNMEYESIPSATDSIFIRQRA